MKFLIVFGLCVFLFVLKGQTHPIYVSICELNYNAQNRTLEIMLKVFTDDLEAGVQKRFKGIKLLLDTPRQHPQSDKYIADYVQEKLSIRLDDKTTPLKFVGRETENDAQWVYFEVANIKRLNKVEVDNRILFELLTGQLNIVHLQAGTDRRNCRQYAHSSTCQWSLK